MIDSLADPIRVVSVRDPAIDWHAMREHGVTPLVYAETRDEQSVRVLPGAAPRWYHLRPLSVVECAACDAQPTPVACALLAFRLGVTRIENFHGVGIDLYPELPTPGPNGSTRMTWSDAGLQRIADTIGGQRVLYEIGAIVHERASEGNARSGDVIFTPPQFLQPVLNQIALRLAERRETNGGIASSATPPSDNPNPSV